MRASSAVAPPIPLDATFRRAEALTFHINLCRGVDRFAVSAERQSGRTETSLTAREAELLSRLSRWQTADEAGVSHDELVSLVSRNCAFWSSIRPSRNLHGEWLGSLDSLEGRVALRSNVQLRALATTSRGTDPLVHMPRRGSLDRACLGGVLFVSHEMETAVAWARLGCCARHALVARELLPLLDGTHDFAELASTPERRALLTALASLGLLERHSPPPPWNGEARVTWLGHAGILYEAHGKRILVDPVFYAINEPTRLRERPFDGRDVGPIDAVLITHGDNDHLNPDSLMRLPRDTPIYIPRTPEVEPYQVDMAQLLWTIACKRVIEVDPWERIELGDVTVVVAPFQGEDWGLTLACRSYLIHGRDLTIFANADSTSSPEVYERLKKEFRVDLAFVGVTGAAETYAMPPGYGYGDFYANWIPKERQNEWVELCNGPVESAKVAADLGARYAFGYAAGGPPYCTVAYCDRGSHGQLADLLRAAGPGAPKPLDLVAAKPARVPAD
jgi:L-ascorbate metabolism protein UlaG (beta-lactamase superfamily)